MQMLWKILHVLLSWIDYHILMASSLAHLNGMKKTRKKMLRSLEEQRHGLNPIHKRTEFGIMFTIEHLGK